MNQFSERGPWTVVGGLPVYASTALVGLHGATLLLGVLASLLGYPWTGVAQFSVQTALFKGCAWQYFTYPFCNPPSIWFVLEMFLLYRFGREIEEFLGRPVFLRLYLLQVVLPPLCLTAVDLLGAWLGWGTGGLRLSGSAGLHFAVFFAYACVFPGIPVLFGLRAVWVAVILLAVYSLERLTLLGSGGGMAAWGELLVLWAGSLGGALYATWEKGVWDFSALPFAGRTPVSSARRKNPGQPPLWGQVFGRLFGRVRDLFRRKPRFEVVRGPLDPGLGVEGMECEELLASIDPLLEKISRSGLASLTPGERARLEAARAELMRKETARR
jgi:hypothetical protein